MATLYELTGDYKRLEELEEELDLEVFQDTMDSITGAIEEKAIGYARVIDQFEADVKMLDDKEKRLAKRRQAIKTKVRLMKNHLFEAMEIAGTPKIKSPEFTVWVQNNPISVSVTNEKVIPKEFYIPQPPKLDKKQLREELRHGDIPGVELVQTRGIRIK